MTGALLPLLLLFADPKALATELAYLGRDAFLGGEWRAAVGYFELATRFAPGRPDLYAAKGLASAAVTWAERQPCQNRYVSPIKLPEGKDASSWLARAKRLYELGRHAEAMEAVEQALALDSKSAAAWSLRAELYFALHKPSDALVTAQMAERRDPSAMQPYITQMHASIMLQDRESYETASKKLTEVGVQNDQYFLGMARLCTLMGDDAKEASYLSRVLQQDPKSVPALRMRAITRRRAGIHHGAIADLEASLDRDPESAYAWHELAWLHFELKDYSSAVRCLDQAMKYGPRESAHYHSRANCRSALRQETAKFADYSRAIALDPSNPEPRIARAVMLHHLSSYRFGEWPNRLALAELDRVLRVWAEHANAHDWRSMCLMKLGRWAEATQALKRATELRKASKSASAPKQPFTPQ